MIGHTREKKNRRSHLGTSEQLCMIVQSAISEVTLAPVWYRPGFLMDVFGLEVNQISGMSSALCCALRLALLSHDVSLRFQSIIWCWYVVKASACKSACVQRALSIRASVCVQESVKASVWKSVLV